MTTLTDEERSFLQHCYYTTDDFCEWMDYHEFVSRYGEALLNGREDSPRKRGGD